MENYSADQVLLNKNKIKILTGEKWQDFTLSQLYFKNSKGQCFQCQQVKHVGDSPFLKESHIGYYMFNSFTLPVDKMHEIFRMARLVDVDLLVTISNSKFINDVNVLMSHLNAEVALAFFKYIQYELLANYEVMDKVKLDNIMAISGNEQSCRIKVGVGLCYEDVKIGIMCQYVEPSPVIDTIDEEDEEEYVPERRVMFKIDGNNDMRLSCSIIKCVPIFKDYASKIGIQLKIMDIDGSISFSGKLNRTSENWKTTLEFVKELAEKLEDLEFYKSFHLTTPMF
jgi:hypothetical protein